MKALFLIADGFEDLQFFCPYYRLREDGVAVTIASAVDNHAATGLHGYIVEPDMPVPELNPSEYDILVIPGGRAPEKLRLREEAVDVARACLRDGNLGAAGGPTEPLVVRAGAVESNNVSL